MMYFQLHMGLMLKAELCLSAIAAKRVEADDAEQKSNDVASPQQAARQAIELSLVFLQQDAVKWKVEHKCATCHHGALTVWG